MTSVLFWMMFVGVFVVLERLGSLALPTLRADPPEVREEKTPSKAHGRDESVLGPRDCPLPFERAA